MAPIIYTDNESTMDQKQLFFEASVLHRIPPELLIQPSSSTRYLQSLSNGKTHKSWLFTRRKDRKEERLRRLARFHAELLGKVIENEISDRRSSIDELGNKENNFGSSQNSLVERNERLLDITLKTIVLLHHNQQLQNKLTALQKETKNFVQLFRKNCPTTSN